MKYFEQVHRGIRAPVRALAPAICAVALYTAALMVAAWPTMAEADYRIYISNYPESGSWITVKRLSFKCVNSTWKRFYPGTKQLANNGDNSTAAAWTKKHNTGALCKHKFKVKWWCNSHSASGPKEYVTHSISTYKNGTFIRIRGCTNDDVDQTSWAY